MYKVANTVPTLWSFLPCAIKKKEKGMDVCKEKRGAQKVDLPYVTNTIHNCFLLISFL